MRGISPSQKIFITAGCLLTIAVGGCFSRTVPCSGTAAESVTDSALTDALSDAGFSAAAGQTLRDVLFLYQRTHGLVGTGTADLATRRALGLDVPDTDADAARKELQTALLCDALARFAACHPNDCDLATLTAYAGVLVRRASSPAFPGGLTDICDAGVCSCEGQIAGAASAWTGVNEHRYALFRRAAQDALDGVASPGEDALYVAHKDARPADINVTYEGETLVFYRLRGGG